MLTDESFISGSWANSDIGITNSSGTAVSSGVLNESGEAIADVYTITMSAVSAGTGTATVETASPNNPYKGRVVTGVALDGATLVKNVIPGLNLVFSSGTANTNVSVVKLGAYEGSFDASGTGNAPTAGVRHRVTNTGSTDLSGARARLLTQSILYRKTGNALAAVRPFAELATEKLATGTSRIAPYAIKTVSVSGSGGSKIASVQVDDVTLPADSVLDLVTGTLVSGVGLKAVGTSNWYRIQDGPLETLEFCISPLCANNDVGNVLIFPARYLQIAPDVAGSAGTYGTADVVLTDAAGVSGVLGASGVAYYWTRVFIGFGANSESNPYPMAVALEGNETGSANWAG